MVMASGAFAAPPAASTGAASPQSADAKNTVYSYTITGQISTVGWQTCAAADASEGGCYTEHFDIVSLPVSQKIGNRVELTSKQVRTGYSIEVKGDIVTVSCADELHDKPRFSVQGKLGEKIKVKDICEAVVQAGPVPETTIK